MKKSILAIRFLAELLHFITYSYLCQDTRYSYLYLYQVNVFTRSRVLNTSNIIVTYIPALNKLQGNKTYEYIITSDTRQ